MPGRPNSRIYEVEWRQLVFRLGHGSSPPDNPRESLTSVSGGVGLRDPALLAGESLC
jgi:hypothetical protein